MEVVPFFTDTRHTELCWLIDVFILFTTPDYKLVVTILIAVYIYFFLLIGTRSFDIGV
jgi:hypothetical protein